MTTKLSTRLAFSAWALAGIFVVTNCSAPLPEPPAPAASLPMPVEAVKAPAPAVKKVVAMTTVTPSLEAKAKSVLNAGANVSIAAQGFQSAQQFMATAYAAKNLNLPFMVLKDKIVTHKMSLARAIDASSRYSVNSVLEAARAESEARADLANRTGPQ